MAVTVGLRGAVASSGLSQAGFARATGTSASRFSTYLTGRTVPSASWYLRALRVGEALGSARGRSWLTPVVAVKEIRRALAEGEPVWALRLILQCRDHLRCALQDDEQAGSVAAAWEAAPEPVGVEEWDRLLAGVIGHEFEIQAMSVPAWVTPPPAGGPWQFSSPFFTEAEVRAGTPRWLADQGIFISARDLETA